jgi:Zn2+/Cd2+-exporting ATPase
MFRSITGQSLISIVDWINDARELVSVNVGVVMCEIGTDLALEMADISLMPDKVEKIPQSADSCSHTPENS